MLVRIVIAGLSVFFFGVNSFVYADRHVNDFTVIDLENRREIQNNRLFAFDSNHKYFKKGDFSNSLIFNKIPDDCQVLSNTKTSAFSTIVLKRNSTEYKRYSYQLEGGFFLFDNLFYQIMNSLPNIPLVQAPIAGIAGLLRIPLILIGLYNDQFGLVVDNSLDHKIKFVLDDNKSVNVPARCQMTIVFQRGTRQIKAVKDNGNVIESFKVDCDIVETKEAPFFYVYNVEENNNYEIIKVRKIE
jgi:hypothetical protein